MRCKGEAWLNEVMDEESEDDDWDSANEHSINWLELFKDFVHFKPIQPPREVCPLLKGGTIGLATEMLDLLLKNFERFR